jgi:GWxTD domain-containing protein
MRHWFAITVTRSGCIFMVTLIMMSLPSIVEAQKPKAQKLNRVNLAELYSENRFTDFDAVIFHDSDEESIVFLKVNLDDLLYTADLQTGKHSAHFSIRYWLLSAYESKLPVDTGSLDCIDSAGFGSGTEMILRFGIRAAFPGGYILIVKLADENLQENNSVTEIFPVSKKSRHSGQNFLVTDENNNPVFENSPDKDIRFRIRIRDDSIRQIIIRYYSDEMSIARTPFAIERNIPLKLDADSLYTLKLTGGESELLRLRYPSVYLFQKDPAVIEGLTLFSFSEGFPEVESPVEAVKPLRYLTTQKEFDHLLKQPDLKTAVDSFWLERTSNQPERAMKMIAKFYSRVMTANKLFTSYKEGWKTDRGIIYIVYGAPSEVYRRTGEEEWIYGERSNMLSIRFFFDQAENPLSDNDYILQRSSGYKPGWYIAVENWRR